MDVRASRQAGAGAKADATEVPESGIARESKVGETEPSVNLIFVVQVVINACIEGVLLERTRATRDVVSQQVAVGGRREELQDGYRLR